MEMIKETRIEPSLKMETIEQLSYSSTMSERIIYGNRYYWNIPIRNLSFRNFWRNILWEKKYK